MSIDPLQPLPTVGASVEPGLRAALDDAVLRALRERGVATGGAGLQLEVVRSTEGPEAGVPGVEAGTVVYTSDLVVRASVPSRPGCALEVDLRRSWLQPGSDPYDAIGSRQDAVSQLAWDAAQRLVDGLLGQEACR